MREHCNTYYQTLSRNIYELWLFVHRWAESGPRAKNWMGKLLAGIYIDCIYFVISIIDLVSLWSAYMHRIYLELYIVFIIYVRSLWFLYYKCIVFLYSSFSYAILNSQTLTDAPIRPFFLGQLPVSIINPSPIYPQLLLCHTQFYIVFIIIYLIRSHSFNPVFFCFFSCGVTRISQKGTTLCFKILKNTFVCLCYVSTKRKCAPPWLDIFCNLVITCFHKRNTKQRPSAPNTDFGIPFIQTYSLAHTDTHAGVALVIRGLMDDGILFVVVVFGN